MRGLAEAGTLTGDVQRVLTDEWKTQGQIVYDADLHSVKAATLTALLARLVQGNRAEKRWATLPPAESMAGGRWEYRAPQTNSEEAVCE